MFSGGIEKQHRVVMVLYKSIINPSIKVDEWNENMREQSFTDGVKRNILKVQLGVLSFTPLKILMFFLMLYGNVLVELRTENIVNKLDNASIFNLVNIIY